MANSKRRCPTCKTYNKAEGGKLINNRLFCSLECAVSYGKKNAPKAKAKADKVERVKLRERKAALKPKSKTLNEAQAAFNKYIRIRDYKEPCISCDKSKEEVESNQGWKVGGCWDAGHFQTRGAKGQLRFHLLNCHKQCKSCNAGSGKFSHKAATVDERYRVNLIKKIGADWVDWLECDNEIDTKKNDIEYLQRVKRIFNKRARHYKKLRGIE